MARIALRKQNMLGAMSHLPDQKSVASAKNGAIEALL